MKIKKMLLAAIMAGLILTAAAGCKPASTGSAAGGYAKEINVFNWTEYMPQSVLDAFYKQYGIKVNYSTYSSNEEMIAKLQAGGASQYDVVIPSNYVIKAMEAQKLIEPFDPGSITNIKNISPALLNLEYDKGNQYSVPYMMSPVMLVVNKQKVRLNITSYNDLLDPSLKNSIVVLDDERMIMGLALAASGHSINETDPAKIAQAKAWLQKFRPNIKAYDSDNPKALLISGEATVGFTWNGEAALAMKSNPSLQVVWPKEGIESEIDNLCVTAGAKHKKEAELFINFILDPHTSAMISAAFPYTNPNQAALPYLSDDYKNNPASNVPPEQLAKANLQEDVGAALSLYDKAWTDFRAGS